MLTHWFALVISFLAKRLVLCLQSSNLSLSSVWFRFNYLPLTCFFVDFRYSWRANWKYIKLKRQSWRLKKYKIYITCSIISFRITPSVTNTTCLMVDYHRLLKEAGLGLYKPSWKRIMFVVVSTLILMWLIWLKIELAEDVITSATLSLHWIFGDVF